MRGVLTVDDIANVDADLDAGTCKVTGTGRGDAIANGSQAVVIVDPAGRQVALAAISGAAPQVVDDDTGRGVYVPGVCTLPFAVSNVAAEDGVYTAKVPGLDTEAQFTADTATQVVIKVRR